jgi:HD-like signal output (HDOD) protein/CheY-like chemotaxis protein
MKRRERILFVDDERQVLEGLRDSLRTKRNDWEMEFVESGQAALESFAAAPFDVIVSDMRMPGMNGGELLRIIRDRHPETIRLVLSGYSELEPTLDVAQVAHQFLGKPCRPDELQGVITRACRFQSLLLDVESQAATAGVIALPAAPAAYRLLADLLEGPDVSVAEVAAVVEGNVALFAKLLQIVNSSFFAVGRPITSAHEAVSYLGIASLRPLMLSVEIVRMFSPRRPIPGFSLEALELHSAAVANLGARLAPSKQEAQHAFSAGLLHDIGKLVLLSERPDRLEACLTEARETGRLLHEVEQERSGTTHAGIGAYLLGLWGLPLPIVSAVAAHHEPLDAGTTELDAGTAVTVANAIAGGQPVRPELAALEGTPELDEWRAIANGERDDRIAA